MIITLQNWASSKAIRGVFKLEGLEIRDIDLDAIMYLCREHNFQMMLSWGDCNELMVSLDDRFFQQR